MADHTRRHERIPRAEYPGTTLTLDGLLAKPVEVYIPAHLTSGGEYALLVHFHGASFIPMRAVYEAKEPYALAVVNLGAGSSAYEQPFTDGATFARLLAAVESAVARHAHALRTRLIVSAFSAGYGAVRAILDREPDARAVDSVILLDGLHTSYVPERTPLAAGGALETLKLQPFLAFARAAVEGSKRMLITHSEIFPGTFASTTETADYLIRSLERERTPVLQWGPLGMQQLSEARAGGLAILGFAGNTAPDHVDHLHALVHFLGVFSP